MYLFPPTYYLDKYKDLALMRIDEYEYKHKGTVFVPKTRLLVLGTTVLRFVLEDFRYHLGKNEILLVLQYNLLTKPGPTVISIFLPHNSFDITYNQSLPLINTPTFLENVNEVIRISANFSVNHIV